MHNSRFDGKEKGDTMRLNPYINLQRIEFSVTNACTSHCRHCSVASAMKGKKERIKKDVALSVVSALSKEYDVDSVMTFGGEPLLFAETTSAIHKEAMDCGIPNRQIITNGYFSDDSVRIRAVANSLKASGVNSLLLSVDAFHQAHVPLEKVYPFAEALCKNRLSGFRLHPAWVVSREHANTYNEETEACLHHFSALRIPVSSGNNIFPAGNAAIYLSEFYKHGSVDLATKCGDAPYTDKLDDVETIGINPNGDVIVCCFVIGNVYKDSIVEILKRYRPDENPLMAALLRGGVRSLVKLAEEKGVAVDVVKRYSACDVCREIVRTLDPRL